LILRGGIAHVEEAHDLLPVAFRTRGRRRPSEFEGHFWNRRRQRRSERSETFGIGSNENRVW
jgi:hypothetical protein